MKLVSLAVALCICSTLNVEANKGCQAKQIILSLGQTKLINHSANENCQWDIEVPENKVPEITFDNFIFKEKNVSCDDVVKVWSGDYPDILMAMSYFEFCGVTKGSSAFTGIGKYMTVIFETDASHQTKGFSTEVTVRDPGCEILEKDKHIFGTTSYPGYCVTCHWLMEDSFEMYFNAQSLRDDDSISFYKTEDLSLVKQIRGRQLKEEVIHGNYSMTLQFKSSCLFSYSPAYFGFNFRVYYNCYNFEISHHQGKSVTWEEARTECVKNGPGWDLAITDKECKYGQMKKMYMEDYKDGAGPQWFGLNRYHTYHWVNEKKLKPFGNQWNSGEPNNDTMKMNKCVDIRLQEDNIGWNTENCKKVHSGYFCSKLKE